MHNRLASAYFMDTLFSLYLLVLWTLFLRDLTFSKYSCSTVTVSVDVPNTGGAASAADCGKQSSSMVHAVLAMDL